MKALSVRQPYAHLIMVGEKELEFRTWDTDYRGDLLICSTASPKVKNTIPGHALCVVRLFETFEVTAQNYKDFGLDEKPDGKMYAWQLDNVRLINPFPVKGKLNFFNVEDEKIEIVFDDDEESDEADEIFQNWYDTVFAPKLYTGKKAN